MKNKMVYLSLFGIVLLSNRGFAQSDAVSFSDSANIFAMELYGKMISDSGNIVVSPYSISEVLTMAYAGAKGKTAKEMESVLHIEPNVHQQYFETDKLLSEINKGKNQLVISNKIWPQKKYAFLPAYLSLLQKKYQAAITPLDFVKKTDLAQKTINDWVLSKTNEKIKDMIPAGFLNANTRMVLTNAVYFNGIWSSKFKPEMTTNRNFNLLSGETVIVPIMEQTGRFNFTKIEGVSVLELPYIEDQLSMLFFVPDAKDGLSALEKKMSMAFIKNATDSFQRTKIEFFLPKFKIENSVLMRDVLISLGMPTAFSNNADFSGMNGKKDLFMEAVLHKAFIDVNEGGTEAAASSAVKMAFKGAPEQIEQCVADHPFMYVLKHNQSGAILFMGRVMNPVM
jgi:serpin B